MCVCVLGGGWGERGECFRSWIFLSNRDASPFFFYSRFTTAYNSIYPDPGFFSRVCVCVCVLLGVGEGERGDKRGSCIY